jgi:hypothetical protein
MEKLPTPTAPPDMPTKRHSERKDPVGGASEYHPKRAFSPQRLLLRVLLKGLGDAVRRFDQPVAEAAGTGNITGVMSTGGRNGL